MAIKVLIRRRFEADKIKEATELLFRTRYAAMKMKGYISSETLSSMEDSANIAVISMWHSIDDWKQWAASGQRIEYANEMRKIMKGPEQIELFNLGGARVS